MQNPPMNKYVHKSSLDVIDEQNDTYNILVILVFFFIIDNIVIIVIILI